MMEDYPVKTVARAAFAQTCWVLGCRVHPFQWNYDHLVDALDVNWVMEAYLKNMHELGWCVELDELHD